MDTCNSLKRRPSDRCQIALAAAFVSSSVGCAREVYVVSETPPADGSNSGLVYYLPKTELKLQLSTKATSYSPGKYHPVAHWVRTQEDECVDAADRYAIAACLCDGDVVCLNLVDPASVSQACGQPTVVPESSLEIVSSSLQPAIVPDHEQSYFIQPAGGKGLVSRSFSFEFTSEGLFKSGEGSVDDTLPETIVASATTLASIAGAFFGTGAAGAATQAAAKVAEKAKEDASVLKSLGGPMGLMRRVAQCRQERATTSDACLRSLSHPEAVDALKGAKLTASQVCSAAKHLAEARTTRKKHLEEWGKAGQGAAYGLVLTELEEEITRLEGEFGVKKVETTASLVRSVPLSEKQQCLKIEKGVLSNFSSECAERSALSVTVDSSSWEKEKCKGVPRGVIYRLPATGKATLAWNGHQSQTSFALPQFGQCLRAPNVVKGKSGKLVAKVSEETGMLVGFTLEQDANYSEQVESIGKSIGEVASEAARHAEKQAEKNDPVSVKKRELELLELDRRIECYRKLGTPCPSAE